MKAGFEGSDGDVQGLRGLFEVICPIVDQGVVKEIFRDVLGPGFTFAYLHQTIVDDDAVQPGGELGLAFEVKESLKRRDIGIFGTP